MSVRDDLFSRADAAAPTFAADVAAGDDLRRLPDTSVAALRAARLHWMKVPSELGGDEAEPDVQFEVFERVAAVSACAAWCLFIHADTAGVVSARLPDAGLEQLYAGGDAPLLAGGGGFRPAKAERVDGGYLVSGTFRYGSGIHEASHVLLTGVIPNESGPPEIRSVVVPTAELDVADTWHMLGMRGTGSTDFSADRVFVPDALTFAARGEPLRRGGRMFRTGPIGYLGHSIPAVALGMVRAVLEELVATAAGSTRGLGRPQALAGRGAFQNALGEANQRLRAARALMITDGRELMEAVDRGAADLPAAEAATRAAGAYATQVARDVLHDLARFAGGPAMALGTRFERAVRDLGVASTHLVVNDVAYENHAQFLLGLPGADPFA